MNHRIPQVSRRPRGVLQTVRALVCAMGLAALFSGCDTAPMTGVAPGTGAAGPMTAGAGGSAAQAHGRLIEAFNGCQEPAFLAAYAPLFTFTTSNTRQVLTTREALQRYLAAGCANRPNPTATLVQQSTRVSGAITVFSGQYRFKVPVNSPGAAPGQTVEVLQNFTAVFERMGDRWLMLAHHVSVAP